MRAIKLGRNATLIILSSSDLGKLNSKHSSSVFMLEDQEAPGFGVIVESDFDHKQRSGDALKRTNPTKSQNNAGKNGEEKETQSARR